MPYPFANPRSGDAVFYELLTLLQYDNQVSLLELAQLSSQIHW